VRLHRRLNLVGKIAGMKVINPHEITDVTKLQPQFVRSQQFEVGLTPQEVTYHQVPTVSREFGGADFELIFDEIDRSLPELPEG
jgi:hypothetical protein